MARHSYRLGSALLLVLVAVTAASEEPLSPGGAVIRAALLKADELKESASQVTLYRETVQKVQRLAPGNQFVQEDLQKALVKAKDEPAEDQALVLRNALLRVQGTLEFKPVSEAPLPEGFPETTPVGEIRVQRYPEYRLARVAMKDGEKGAFMTLFNHIQKKEIAMTAPVELTYKAATGAKPKEISMAFVYRNVRQGKTGTEGAVEVVDVPAMTVVSIGISGEDTPERIVDAEKRLQAWMKEHEKDYEVSGPLRVLGYNSPFLPAFRRYWEVQLPIRKKEQGTK